MSELIGCGGAARGLEHTAARAVEAAMSTSGIETRAGAHRPSGSRRAWRTLALAGIATASTGCRDGFAATLASVAPIHSDRGASTGEPGTVRVAVTNPGEVTHWVAQGATVRVLEATVAADGAGTWRVRMAVEVTATSHAGFELRPSSLVVIGEGAVDPVGTRVPSLRLDQGDSVRSAMTWRLHRETQPSAIDLVWRDVTEPTPHTVPLAAATPVSVWLRALRAHRGPERVTLGPVREVRLGSTAETLVRFDTTIVNTSGDTIEVDRAQFQVEGDGAPLELVTTATRSTYYGQVASYCQVNGAWLGEHVQVLPGQSVTGAVCFRRSAPSATRLVRVTYGSASAPSFSGHFLAAI